MKKLRLLSLVVLVLGMNRSPRSAKQRPGRPLSATVQTILLKYAGLVLLLIKRMTAKQGLRYVMPLDSTSVVV